MSGHGVVISVGWFVWEYLRFPRNTRVGCCKADADEQQKTNIWMDVKGTQCVQI